MLRIRRKGGAWFEFRGIDRSQAGAVAASFLQQWGTEFTDPFPTPLDSRTADPNNANPNQARAGTRRVAASEYEAVWQDGNGDWDEGRPTETVPLGGG